MSLVCIIDDDPSVRRALRRLLTAAGHATAEFASATDFLNSPVPDGAACLVLDVQMPGLNGLDLQQELRRRQRDLPIVFISGKSNIPMSVSAMKAGAVDFLPKPFRDEALLEAIAQASARAVEQRRTQVAHREARARLDTLTPREFEVLELVLAGLLNKQIGSELGACEKTIKVHRGRVMEKMGVTSVAELVVQAQRGGVTPQAGVRPKSHSQQTG